MAETVPLLLTNVMVASLAASLLLCGCLSLVACTPLDDYVNKPDPSYEFRDLGNSVKMDGYTVYYLNMTSQTWLSCKLLAFSSPPPKLTKQGGVALKSDLWLW